MASVQKSNPQSQITSSKHSNLTKKTQFWSKTASASKPVKFVLEYIDWKESYFYR